MRKNGRLSPAAAITLALVAVAAGWIAGTFFPIPSIKGEAAPPSVTAPPASTAAIPPLLSTVPDVRQSSGYTCGAAALQAVLAYWGTNEREDRLVARLHSTPEAGTHPLDIVRVARDFGLTAELREGLELADLEAALASRTTVIVDLQAWRSSADLPWTETWDDGHYMVLLGADRDNLYFEDPSLLGTRGTIPRSEFLDRWHDYEGDPPLDPTDRKYVHMAIFLRGSQPASPSPFSRVYLP
jgi:predicted double-glycine peptidase